MAKHKKLRQPTVPNQILKTCSALGPRHSNLDEEQGLPLDVSKGHFVVYVGQNRIHIVVPTSYLAHPEFLKLLRHSEEEFGFCRHLGLTIPCEEVAFRSFINSVIRCT